MLLPFVLGEPCKIRMILILPIMSWTFGEPASVHTFALLDEFQYRPQVAEAYYPKDDGDDTRQ